MYIHRYFFYPHIIHAFFGTAYICICIHIYIPLHNKVYMYIQHIHICILYINLYMLYTHTLYNAYVTIPVVALEEAYVGSFRLLESAHEKLSQMAEEHACTISSHCPVWNLSSRSCSALIFCSPSPNVGLPWLSRNVKSCGSGDGGYFNVFFVARTDAHDGNG